MSKQTIMKVFFLLLILALPAMADNHLDIMLEGPWILYQDNTFITGRTVLVAMTPPESGLYAHKPPIFSAGYGYTMNKTGVYCVAFNTVCAPDRAVNSLMKDGYATEELLQVSPLQHWKWSDNPGVWSTYIVFPMPDSYSNDGVYKMSFGAKFMSHDSEEEHSIGIMLHYNNGPSSIDLYECDTADAGTCKTSKSPLQSTGTLQIVMKAPPNIDACDQHVRAAYPQMLQMLDPTPLMSGKNVNYKIAYIDIPTSIDSSTGKGMYSSKCYTCDQQNTDQSQCSSQMPMSISPRQLDLSTTLNGVVSTLGSLQVDQEKLAVPELRKETAALGARFPSFSDLNTLDELLTRSVTAMSQILIRASNSGELKVQSGGSARNTTFTTLDNELSTEEELLRYVRYLSDAKNGSDCRAPIMILPPYPNP